MPEPSDGEAAMPEPRDGRKAMVDPGTGHGVVRPESCDADVRRAVTGTLDRTYLVEAAAGTGKTSILVARYLSCVLAGTPVSRIAAITFTEKAAGELRFRIRDELANRCLVAGPSRQLLADALRDLDDAPISTIHGFAARLLRERPVDAGIDPAFEQLDAFGSALFLDQAWQSWLERVLSAGQEHSQAEAPARDANRQMPTQSPNRDADEQDLTQSPAGEANEQVRSAVSTVLSAGVALSKLRELAELAFSERYDLGPAPPPTAAPDLGGAIAVVRRRLDELGRYCGQSCSEPGDKGLLRVTGLIEAAGSLQGLDAADPHQQAAALRALPLYPKPGGAKGNWGSGGKDRMLELWQEVHDDVRSALLSYGDFVCRCARTAASSFAVHAAAAQQNGGALDFADLLGKLRDALRDDTALRQDLQRAFDYLLVDEFQDTDPLQAELIVYLAQDGLATLAADCAREAEGAAGLDGLAGDPAARGAGEPGHSWRAVRLKPGKLFVVGDPKQSIYRFRRADIGMYHEVCRLLERQGDGRAGVEAVQQNFRTTPAIARWVNEVFEEVIGGDAEPGRQPGYVALAPARPDAGEPRVTLLVGPQPEGTSGRIRRAEAEAIAALLHDGVRGGSWCVRDKQMERERDRSGGSSGGSSGSTPAAEPTRSARWGDIAILMRAFTHVETLERALRAADIPYRTEGGRAYFQRREVVDTLLALRVVDDPTDQLAVYGTLHSTLFGFSDEELFLFAAAGGRFDVLAAEAEGTLVKDAGAGAQGDGIFAALALLRDLHLQRAGRSVEDTLADLLARTRAYEAWAAWAEGAEQVLANLEKLVGLARAFAARQNATLHGFVRWAEQAASRGAEAESIPAADGEAVRIMTIHGAKGLEFPVVVLAAATGKGQSRERRKPLVDRRSRALACALAVPGGHRDAGEVRWPAEVATIGFDERLALEKQHDESERRRLLYVAATRACDRLVIPCFEEPDGSSLASSLGHWLPLPGSVGEYRADGDVEQVPAGSPQPFAPAGGEESSASAALDRRQSWLDERERLLEAAGHGEAVTSPSRLEDLDMRPPAAGEEQKESREFVRRRARALALGSAVHAVMEAVDLSAAGGDELASLAAAAADEQGYPELADEVAIRAAACLQSAPVREAAAARRVYRELPLVVEVPVPTGVPAPASAPPLLEGFCDLLYQAEDGWVVVDYKTDTMPSDEVIRGRYELQGGAYALAVQQITGERVARICFVMAGSSGRPATAGDSSSRPAPATAPSGPGAPAAAAAAPVLEIPVTDDLLERAAARASAAATEGAAVDD